MCVVVCIIMSSMVQALVVVGGCQSFDLFQKEEKDVKMERRQWRALDCTPTMRKDEDEDEEDEDVP